MIAADHFLDNQDGTAWTIVKSHSADVDGLTDKDRPCDNPDCPHVREPLPVVALDRPCAVNTAGHEIEGGYRRLGDGRLAHRMVWESQHGPIPDGMVVMHLCDNPPCCEPTHLKLGTRAENNADRDRKGRNRRPNQRGEAHSNAKLTDADVDAILASDEPATVLGPRYGVNPDHVRRIRRGDRRTKKAVCPDCGGTGRHTFTIEVACEACGDRHDIPIGDSSGGATLRVHVLDVLPIVENAEWDGTTLPIICRSTFDRDYFLRLPLPSHNEGITLPPAAAPGQYAVKVQFHQNGENQ